MSNVTQAKRKRKSFGSILSSFQQTKREVAQVLAYLYNGKIPLKGSSMFFVPPRSVYGRFWTREVWQFETYTMNSCWDCQYESCKFFPRLSILTREKVNHVCVYSANIVSSCSSSVRVLSPRKLLRPEVRFDDKDYELNRKYIDVSECKRLQP